MNIKSLFLFASILLSVSAYAQKGELNKGKTSYSKFNEVKLMGKPELGMKDLEAARTALEKASLHEKTSGLSETWTYLALAYTDYAMMDTTGANPELKEKAIAAIAKAKAGEGNEAQAENIDVAAKTLAQIELTGGIRAFEKQDFAGAYQAFNKGLDYLPGDTLFTYYAGLAAINAKDYKSGIEKYKSLLAHENFSNLPQIYLDLSRLSIMEADTVSALKFVEEGAAKFPENEELATHNIEMNLQMGNEEKVISDIKAQIARNPQDAKLQYYYGIALAASENNADAETAYKKAIELDPEFTNAYINLSGIVLNKGIEILRKANDLPASKQKEYLEQVKAGNVFVDEALPYLQKATELAPEMAVVWQNLKTYYILKDDKEKAAELDTKIGSLQ